MWFRKKIKSRKTQNRNLLTASTNPILSLYFEKFFQKQQFYSVKLKRTLPIFVKEFSYPLLTPVCFGLIIIDWIERRETKLPHQVSSFYIGISISFRTCLPRMLVVISNIFSTIFMWRYVCTSHNMIFVKYSKNQAMNTHQCFQFIYVSMTLIFICIPLHCPTHSSTFDLQPPNAAAPSYYMYHLTGPTNYT